MKILVCIKQIEQTGEMGRFDAIALEEAFRFKEESIHENSTRIDVVTLGSDSNETVIRRAFGMGAENGFHIQCAKKTYRSAIETASLLADMARLHSYDLILAGVMSDDMMAGQTGPMMAQILNLPCATGIVKLNPSVEASQLLVEREMENGCLDCLEIQMPCLLTIQAGVNPPRYPSLSKMLAAKNKEIIVFSQTRFSDQLHHPELVCLGVEKASRTRKGEWLKGDLQTKTDGFLYFLKQKGVV